VTEIFEAGELRWITAESLQDAPFAIEVVGREQWFGS